jgi:hypothetical protein
MRRVVVSSVIGAAHLPIRVRPLYGFVVLAAESAPDLLLRVGRHASAERQYRLHVASTCSSPTATGAGKTREGWSSNVRRAVKRALDSSS